MTVHFIHVKFKVPIRNPTGDVESVFIGPEEEKNPVKDTMELYSDLLLFSISSLISKGTPQSLQNEMVGLLDRRKSESCNLELDCFK